MNEPTHLFLGEATTTDDGWTTVLPVGEWAYRPGPGGVPIPKPIRVVEGSSPNPDYAVGLADLMEAWEARAVENVTLPTSHDDLLHENAGFVTDMRVGIDPRLGTKALQIKMDVTEPEVRGRLERKTIRGRSAGLKFGYVDKKTGRKFPAVIDHVALTNKPWLQGLGGFAGFSEDGPTAVLEAPQMLSVEERICDQLDTWTRGRCEFVALEHGVATVLDEDGDPWHVPVHVDGATVRVERPASWSFAAPTTGTSKGGDMKTAREMTPEELLAYAESLEARVETAEGKTREQDVDARIAELQSAGLSEDAGWSGFLAQARKLMLADDGGPAAVLLSEDGRGRTTDAPFTVTEIVESLIEALPVDTAAGLGLGEQGGRKATAGAKPPRTTAQEQQESEDPQERADAMRRALGIQTALVGQGR